MVWYAECHEKAIVYLSEPHYLCTVIHSQREMIEKTNSINLR